MRYFFHIGYNGSNYNGWQKLPQANSVEAVVETTLSQILKREISIVGCGRTDSGVHAGQFFFHLDVDEPWDFDLKFRLNKNLPGDIAIFDILPMEGSPHARFDAVERTYDYFVHFHKNPFYTNNSVLWEVDHLDFSSIENAVALLPVYSNYKSFCRFISRQRTTECNVTRAACWLTPEKDRFRFQISANRFLTGMVRIIAQKLFEVGSGKMSVDEFESLLSTKHEPKTILPAPGQGLYLSKVTYPFLDMPSRSTFLQPVSSSEWLPL